MQRYLPLLSKIRTVLTGSCKQGDLGHTDLQEDLEFHSSSMSPPAPKVPSVAASSLRKKRYQPRQIHKNPANSTSLAPAFEDPNPRNKLPPSSGPNPFSSTSNNDTSTLGSKRFLWSLSFYAQFFDVDTSEVLRRCRTALFPRSNFLDILDGNPDLYGPFWIATTVVFILFITGTISQYLASIKEERFEYDFRLLSGASGLIYGYTGLIPVGLWGVLKWFGSEGANLLECWALYGYANLIWIPVALVSWSPVIPMNLVFVGIGFVISALFLVRNLYPAVNVTDARTSKILIAVVVALHAGYAIAIAILFFA